MSSVPPERQNEVRPYLVRLVSTIAVGILVMTSVATWAWHHYGKRLADAPPLPSGTPPFSNAPVP
jgi:hypothetical protein